MKHLLIFSLCVLAASAWSRPTNDPDVTSLYNLIIAGDYEAAAAKTINLKKNSKLDVVKNVVTMLINDGKREVFDYGYELWYGEFRDGEQIVKDNFPESYKLILSQKRVKITSYKYDLSLKLGESVDELGDRTAYAHDMTSDTLSWKFIPVKDGNKVYFKIYSMNYSQYLKLGVSADGQNEHAVYGEQYTKGAKTHRHQWYLKPALHNGNVLFFIRNREYEQGLKLSGTTDYAGDQQVFSNASELEDEPELWGWSAATF